jgi:hypothetical protein
VGAVTTAANAATSVDDALVRRARSGDAAAFEVLVDTRIDRCYRIARSILSDVRAVVDQTPSTRRPSAFGHARPGAVLAASSPRRRRPAEPAPRAAGPVAGVPRWRCSPRSGSASHRTRPNRAVGGAVATRQRARPASRRPRRRRWRGSQLSGKWLDLDRVDDRPSVRSPCGRRADVWPHSPILAIRPT